MSNSFTNIFTGSPVQPATVSYIALSLTGNVQLNWPTQFIDTGDVAAEIIDISVNNNGYNVFLPNATEGSVGQTIIFVNTSGVSHTFNIVDFNSGNIATLSTGQSIILYLTDNSTSQGSWRLIPFGGGFSGVTSVSAAALTGGITIGGSPITTAGTLTFSLGAPLVSLSALGTTGILVQSVVGTVISRALVGGLNIDITNPDGVSGNPVINLSDTLTGMSSITVGNINLTNNVISTTTPNTDLKIIPNGTGSILLGQGLTPPTVSSTGNISNIVNLTVTTQADIAKVRTSTNVITSTDGTGNLTIAASGTGSLTLKGNSNINPLVINQNNFLQHLSIIKSWVAFGWTGSAVAVFDGYNVAGSAVVRNSVGVYTVTTIGGIFSTSIFSFVSVSSNTPTVLIANSIGNSTTTAIIYITDVSGTLTDPFYVTWAAFGR